MRDNSVTDDVKAKSLLLSRLPEDSNIITHVTWKHVVLCATQGSHRRHT